MSWGIPVKVVDALEIRDVLDHDDVFAEGAEEIYLPAGVIPDLVMYLFQNTHDQIINAQVRGSFDPFSVFVVDVGPATAVPAIVVAIPGTRYATLSDYFEHQGLRLAAAVPPTTGSITIWRRYYEED